MHPIEALSEDAGGWIWRWGFVVFVMKLNAASGPFSSDFWHSANYSLGGRPPVPRLGSTCLSY